MTDSSGEASVVINAPAEKIFSYIADLERHSEWNYQPYRIEKTSTAAGVGATYHAFERMPADMPFAMKLMMRPVMLLTGTKMETDATVTAVDAPRRLAWEARAPGRKRDMMRSRWELELTPEGDGTKVTERFTFIPQMRFPGAPPAKMVQAEILRNLQTLKGKLEGPGT